MLRDLMLAFALVLVLEGLLPALNPRGWKSAVEQVAQASDQTIRRFGIVMLIAGVILFHVVR